MGKSKYLFRLFSYGYTPNWSNETFTKKKVKQTNIIYILEDGNIQNQILFISIDTILLTKKEKICWTHFTDVYFVEKILKSKAT